MALNISTTLITVCNKSQFYKSPSSFILYIEWEMDVIIATQNVVVYRCASYGGNNHMYSGTPLKGHPLDEDTSLIRTLDQVPTSFKYVLFAP